MNANEQALYDLAERTNSPGYSIDPFLAASALPQNARPETRVVDSQEAIEREHAKANAEAEAARAAGYVNGTVSGKPAAKLVGSANLGDTTQANPLLVNIEAQLKRATESTDTMEAASILGSVRGEIAKESARFYKENQGIAYAEFGVPGLEAALQQAIQMDDQAPGYRARSGMADSDETADVRRQLQSAKQAADSSINERLAGNGVYQELAAKAKTIESIAAHRVQRDLDGDARKQAEADEFYYSRPPEQRKLMDEAFGNDKGDPRVALANLKMMSGKDKEDFKAVVEGGERVVPKLAIAGNVYARRIAIAREAKVFGSPEVANKELEEVEVVANDNRRALEEFTKLKAAGYFGIGPEVDKLGQNVTLLLGPAAGTSSEDKERQRAQRIDIAIRFAKYSTEKEFNSDIMALRTKADIPPPDWLVAEAASGRIGKIDKNAAITLANKPISVAERQVRIKQLVDYYGSAAENQNKSMFFQVSPLAVDKLKTEISLLGVFGKALDKVLPDVSFGVPNMTGQNLQDYMNQQVER